MQLCTYAGILLRVFELERIDLNDWGCKNTFELKNAWFEWFEVKKVDMDWWGLDLNKLRMQKHIWVGEGLTWVVWRCQIIFE